MYLIENPVLQRELLVNLRMHRAFFLLAFYMVGLSLLVYFAWPTAERLDISNPVESQRLLSTFFLGQFVLASLMVPSFAAGAITGEKERQTYEMLLASPIRPAAIVLGKLLASLCYMAVLMFASLPIVLLCLPLGGMSFYEVLAVYLALFLSVLSFGMISIACSSYFKRTAASLVVSYLIILPLALQCVLIWSGLGATAPYLRLLATVTVLPVAVFCTCGLLLFLVSRRLLHPPDVGAEGQEVVDEATENRQAVGLVIQRDQFPDRLFAPPKRTDLLPDGVNPVYDKEMRSELFSQGTLMLRLVIQLSMLLAIPLMGAFLYILPNLAAWYVSYVILFNVLVGPVFSAGSVTSERERQTLELLLTTTLTPWQIIRGKLLAGLRVSTVLTSFLLWPIVLAVILVPPLYGTLPVFAGYLAIIAMTCLTTSLLALACSVLFQKTSVAMMVSYLALITLFCLPIGVWYFAESFYPQQPLTPTLSWLTFTSPFGAAFQLPLKVDDVATANTPEKPAGNWQALWLFLGFYTLLSAAIILLMIHRFSNRWLVSQG